MTAAPPAAPPAFARAVDALRSVTPRPEIELSEVPAPQRLAPYAFALSGAVVRLDDEVATGRLILLHDPAGHEAWEGTLRLVTYVTAELEPELAADPLLPSVGWSWLSTRFGEPAGPPPAADVEIRASWTPIDTDLSPHLRAWCEVLASTAGLPPPGVTALAERRMHS
jgi:DUF3000 family protein